MEILELWLKRYGKFENHRIRLKPGINIIYGGNETGKSTLHSFIRAMFFGLGRARGRAARTDEYQLRQPWDAPGAFLGSMRVQEDGETYRIDRCFDRSTTPIAVTCETQGLEFERPEEAMEALLGGISENVFVNTVFIPQAHAETEEALASELRRYMVNSDSALDAQLDVTQALQSLRKKKKALVQKKKKEEEALETAIDKKLAEAEEIRRELELLKRQSGRYQKNYDAKSGRHIRREPDASEGRYGWHGSDSGKAQCGQRRRNGSDSGKEQYGQRRQNGSENGKTQYGQRGRNVSDTDEYGKHVAYDAELLREDWEEDPFLRWKRVIIGLLILAGILALAGAAFLTDWKLRIFLGIFGVVFLALTVFVQKLSGGEAQSFAEDSLPEMIQTRKYPAETDARDASDSYLMEELRVRQERYERLQDELEALYQKHVQPAGTDTELAAVSMAIDRICELSSGIYAKSGGQLNERASEILSELTDGAYSRVVLDETMEVRIHTPERVLGLHQVSGGTMQQIYFALRMAAGELLCGDKQLPVVLDETFAMYDDARLEAALRFLKKSGRQVILFTCQKREREILARL